MHFGLFDHFFIELSLVLCYIHFHFPVVPIPAVQSFYQLIFQHSSLVIFFSPSKRYFVILPEATLFYGCSIHLLLLGIIKLVNLVTKTNSVYCQRTIKKHIAS